MTAPAPHPVAAIFPILSATELQDLAHDIAAQGLLHPVVLDDQGRVLDGRNRLAACNIANVEPSFTTYRGDDPLGFVISENVKRRHLSESQRAMLAIKAEEIYAEQARKRQLATLKQNASDMAPVPRREGLARDQAAAAFGVSGRLVGQAKRVKQASDLAEKVVAGDLPLKRADRILRDREADEKHLEQARAEAMITELPSADIRLGDFREVLADLEGIDAIITDPPYGREYLPLLDDLAAWADKVLAPEGVMLVMFGLYHLEEAMHRLSGHRPYRWTLAYLMPRAGYTAYTAQMQSHWKPVLVYGEGPRADDVITSGDGDAAAKEYHEWGQDLAGFAEMVRRFTRPGMTVCDPLAGSGTTLLAARAQGRHAIGAEIDPVHFETMRRRLAA